MEVPFFFSKKWNYNLEQWLEDEEQKEEDRIFLISKLPSTFDGTSFFGKRVDQDWIYDYKQSQTCDGLRHLLEKIVWMDTKRWEEAGLEYAERTGRTFQKIASFDYNLTQSVSDYALSHFSNSFETSLAEIQAQSNAYGIHYILHQYFTLSDEPCAGDLVVYWKKKKPQHIGIFQGSGIVHSKWNAGIVGHAAFAHEIFFIPTSWGKLARFYRFQQKSSLPELINFSPIYRGRCDGKGFHYEKNEGQDLKRKEIDKLPIPQDVCQQFSEITYDETKKFFGVCIHFALGVVLKTYVMPSGFSGTIQIQAYLDEEFIPILKPQSGDLAVYYLSSKGQNVHFGVYREDHRIESKWGCGAIYKHPPFLVPSEYGDFIRYYRKK